MLNIMDVSMTVRTSSIISLLAIGLFVGCVVKDANTGVSPGSSAADGGAAGSESGAARIDGGASTASDLTCNEIFDCAAGCPDNNADTCSDACLARGSDQGRPLAEKLATCYLTNKCADATCLNAKCLTELTECITQQRAVQPIAGPVPKGAVPAALVGKWSHFYTPTSHRHDFTFNADGTAAEYITTTSIGIGTCATSGIGDYTGNVVFTDTTMTFYATAGTSVFSSCGNDTTHPVKPNSHEYGWSTDASGQLVLVDRGSQSCLDNPASCTDAYTKN